MNTKDIEEIVKEATDEMWIWVDDNKAGSLHFEVAYMKQYEADVRELVTTLTQHHEAELEKVREEMAKEVKIVDDYLRRVTTFSIVTKDEMKKELCEVVDRRFEYLEEGLRKANQGIIDLTPTKTDK